MPVSGARRNVGSRIAGRLPDNTPVRVFHSNNRRRFVVPLLIGFIMGFLLQLNYFMLKVSEHNNFMLKYASTNSNTIWKIQMGEKTNFEHLHLVCTGPNDTNYNYTPTAKVNIAEERNRSKILCWVMSHSAMMNIHIRETWGRRCDSLLFMVSYRPAKHAIDEVRLNTSKTLFLYPTYWQKAREAWCYVYENYLHKADWFLAAHHDSFVVMENWYRYLGIYKHKSNSSIYIGHSFTGNTVPFISTSPGYVFSKAAVQKFGAAYSEAIFPLTDWLSFRSDSITLGDYMNKIGITAVDARDQSSRLLFVPNVLDRHIQDPNSNSPLDLWVEGLQDDLYPVNNGMDCCSDVAIIFRVGQPRKHLRKFEYFIYRLRPYGINHLMEPHY